MTDRTAPAAGLSEAKRALLEKRLRGQAAPTSPRPGIPRRSDPGPHFPMSFAQERMWFADRMEPGTALYHVAPATLITGHVDVPALETALTEVRRRHEALRTTYAMVDGRPVQTVRPATPWRVEVEDLRPALDAAADRDAELQRRLSIEGKRPFDLEHGPVCRAKVFRVSDDDAVLSLTFHHIATDGWAMPIITSELGMIYDAVVDGRPIPLPEPAIQYADYTLWQREQMKGEAARRQAEYWKAKLAGVPHLEIPGDRPRPAVATHRGDFHRFTMGAEVADAVRALARREGVTVNMVVMAAFNVLLHHYTGQDDLAVGTLLGNRHRREVESMVGVTVNTAVLRSDLSDDPPFRELLARTRTGFLEADANQDLPFERVVEELKVERDLSRHPLFQVMYFHHTFVLGHHEQPEHLKPYVKGYLKIRPLYSYGVSLVDIHISQFDLSLATLEMAGGMSCLIEYTTDLFDRPTILRLAAHLEQALREVCARPDERVSRFRVAAPDEARRVVEEWAAPAAPVPAAEAREMVHERFAAAAARAPEAPAVVAEGRVLTYAELDRRANALAHRLRARGVGPESRVGVCMERSPEAVVSLLAVLKAGGAYVPLDPRWPAGRLALVAEDAGMRLCLVRGEGGPRPEGVEALDVLAGADAASPHGPPEGGAAPEGAAYLIYTSGSTGRPKGVVVPHAALAAYTAGAIRTYGVTAADRVLQFASLAFDASAEEVWCALAAGAALVLRTPEMLESVPAFVAGCEEAGVTVASLPTAFWHEWAAQAAAGEAGVPACVRLVILGGERARADRLAGWLRAAGPRVRTLNSYGPTEATVAATAWEAGADAPVHEVPIGRPMPGARAYVLDRALRPSPVGVPGELCLGGPQVARGYHGHPGRTAAAFLPDPFAGEAGARMYRTGDRARWRADGTLEFLGRADDQVKVRGHRVEPGEVDAALAEDAQVRESATVARETAPGQWRLVSYVVPAAGADAGDGDLGGAVRARLRQRLPEYLVPAAVVVLEALPVTSSGKVDRRALPAPEAAAPAGPEAAAEAPSTPVEETLARIWAAVLGRERVGVHDNFFELGGDSILSIQVIARAGREGLRINPKLLFQHQTIAELAPHVAGAVEVVAEQGPVAGPAPLLPIQRVFFDHVREDRHHWNQAFLFALGRRVEPAALQRALDAVLAHHDALRLRYAPGPEGWTQTGAAPGEAVPLETFDLSGLPAAERADALAAHGGRVQAAMDLERGPLFRAALFEGMEDGRPRLLLAAHHLVVDAVSWGVVLEDLAAALEQAEAGRTPALPRKTTSFRYWAERLAEHAAGDEPRREAGYWSSAVPARVAPFPVDRDGPNPEGSADAVSVSLDEEETRALLQDVPPVYGTQVNDALLAALALAYREWAGHDALLVDLEGHGREDLFDDVDLSRTVGWFTTLFPVALELPAGAGPGEALKAVKETLRRVPGRGLGYGLLRWMCPDEDLAATLRAHPRPGIGFNYLGQVDGMTRAADAGAAPLFEPAPESPGPVRSPRAEREHLVEVDGMVAGGRLTLNWFYGRGLHDRATVQRLADAYVAALRALVEHCKDPTAGGFTPSDFPAMAGMDQAALDAVLSQLGEA